MSRVDQVIKDLQKGFEDLREEIKKDINELVESGEITYGDAIRIFKASRMFEIQNYFPDKDHSPFIIRYWIEDVGDWYDRGRTVTFDTILDYIEENNEGEWDEASDAADEPFTPDKDLYEYICKTNYIGFKYDW